MGQLSSRLAVLRKMGCIAVVWAVAVSWATMSLASEIKVVRLHRGIEFSVEIRYQPRLIRIYTLRVDLRDPELRWEVAVAPDTDGPGPGEASLADPIRLARRSGIIAGIGTNPFRLATGPQHFGEVVTPTSWPDRSERAVVDLCGWVKTRGNTISRPEAGFWSFWIGPGGRPYFGNPQEEPAAEIAISGFGPVLSNGKIVASQGGSADPRTAIGVDRENATAILLAVDSPTPGSPYGVTVYELAEIMAERGAWTANQQCPPQRGAFVFSTPRYDSSHSLQPPVILGAARPVPAIIGVAVNKVQ